MSYDTDKFEVQRLDWDEDVVKQIVLMKKVSATLAQKMVGNSNQTIRSAPSGAKTLEQLAQLVIDRWEDKLFVEQVRREIESSNK